MRTRTELEATVASLAVENERLRGERDRARTAAVCLEQECAAHEEHINELRAYITELKTPHTGKAPTS